MRLIVGLGNPGSEYAKTRHNLGFLAIDTALGELGKARWQDKKAWKALVCKIKDMIFVKPQTFVNSSGVAVKKIVDFYKLTPSKILVIRDDIDLSKGKIRGPKSKTGSGGNRGIESIQQSLNSDEIYQLKIGVGRPPAGIEPTDWVLQEMNERELNDYFNILRTYRGKEGGIAETIEDWVHV